MKVIPSRAGAGSYDLTQRQEAIIKHAISMLYSNAEEWNEDNGDDLTEEEIDALRFMLFGN